VVKGPHVVTLMEVPIPKPQEGEVLVETMSVGICGTDLEIIDGNMGYFTSGMAKFPVILGHEWSGTVVALGADVTGFKIGDRVVGETAVPCWECDFCSSGGYNRCPTRTETGIMNRQGALAEYLTFPVTSLHRISAEVPYQTASLIEPSAVAVNAVRRVDVKDRDVVVFGDGPIGLLVLQVARRCYDARRVVVVGATPHRLNKATELGADAVINVATVKGSDIRSALLPCFGGVLPEICIEATGNVAAASMAVDSVRPGGRVIMLGVFSGQTIPLNLDRVVLEEVSLQGVVGSPGVWPATIKAIEQGKIDPSRIVSHRFRLDQLTEALALLRRRDDNVIKVTIDMTAKK